LIVGLLARYMYLELRQIGANFSAYHNFERSPDTQYTCTAMIFGFRTRYPKATAIETTNPLECIAK
jgi:hypothetical protein